MARLRVKFAEIENGWARTILRVEEEEHEYQFSYVYRNAFARLCEALSALIDENQPYTIIWMDEPEEYEMRFLKKSEKIEFGMWCFDDYKRSIEKKPVLEFSICGTYDEICLPFWRALRTLQGFYNEAEFKSRWGEEFPTRELDLLTEALGKSK